MVVTDIISHPYPGSSVIPDHCQITIDRRTLEGETQSSVLSEMQEALALDLPLPGSRKGGDDQTASRGSGFSVSIPTATAPCYTGKQLGGERFFPAWMIDRDSPLAGFALEAMKRTGLPLQTGYYPFCTDGSESAGNRNIPTIGFGPSSPSLAHTIDEYVEFAQVMVAREVYGKLARVFRVN
jgi:acetylornithine deacetylase/succinyl-diaminopimelate desuccinylase-like protein